MLTVSSETVFRNSPDELPDRVSPNPAIQYAREVENFRASNYLRMPSLVMTVL